MDFDNSGSPGRFFTSLVRELKSLAISNIEYFKDGKHSHHAKFHVAFCMLFEYLDLGIEPCFREIYSRVHEFDASPAEKGNGYRSLLRIVQKCCLHILQISRHISTNKESVLFRRAFYMRELEAYVGTLGQLRACLYYAQKLMTYCQEGQLFADEETLDDALAEQLMEDVEMLSQDCFYGRCLGFQFCESMQRPLNVVAIAMASFAEGYQENSQIMKVATSLFNSGKYIMNPDLRAQQQLPSMVCPAVQVDEVFHLGPDSFDMPSADGSEDITITPPCAHTGPAPVQVRLLSYQLREGQEQHIKGSRSPSSRSPPLVAERSRGLVVHCHGGGFVAQSSKSHEVYLRHWAKELDVPILSIDYSLAPESPFPRALEECFYVYAWAVHNCQKLGSTGDVIVLAGDSAGANLVITTAMRAASFDIRRPDGILGVYPSVLVRYTPSPARLLSLMDPLLPAGILSRCLAAYAGVSDEVSSLLAASVTCHIEASAATLRLSSQETQECDWVVVSQDSAARTNTTLKASHSSSTDPASSAGKQNDHLDGLDRPQHKAGQREGDLTEEGEEVELFTRPPGGSALTSIVTGATGKLASYVETCTHLLAKNFSASAPATPEQIPLQCVGESSQDVAADASGSTLDKLSSSVENSPSTPSFHTPLTTPSEHSGGLNAASLPHGPARADVLGTRGGGAGPPSADVEVAGEMVEVSLQDGCVDNSRKGEDIVDGFSLLQPGLLSDPHGRQNLHDKHGPADDQEAFAILGLDEEEEEMKDDEATVGTSSPLAQSLQMDLDSSAASPTPSTTLPSSLLSTPSDDLDSFHILSSAADERVGVLPCEETAEDSQRIQMRDSASEVPLGMFLSQESAELSPSAEKGAGVLTSGVSTLSSSECTGGTPPREEEVAGSPAERKSEVELCAGQSSSSSPSYRSAGPDSRAAEGFDGKAVDLQTAPVKGHPSPDEMVPQEGSADLHTVPAKDNPSPDQTVSQVGSVSNSHLSPTPAAAPFPDPLLSPDSGCLSDEAEKMQTSASSAGATSGQAERAAPHAGPSRDNLHLHLHSTASRTSSSTSFPRSASLPVLGAPSTSHSMQSLSPSDFKRQRHLAQSPLRAIRNIPIVKNPFMSPLLAPDWLLQGLPHLCLVACHLDPLLDDSVMFTRRLRSLGKTVDLVLVDDLPHGFLNFSLASRDAKHASDLCVGKLKQLLLRAEASAGE